MTMGLRMEAINSDRSFTISVTILLLVLLSPQSASNNMQHPLIALHSSITASIRPHALHAVLNHGAADRIGQGKAVHPQDLVIESFAFLAQDNMWAVGDVDVGQYNFKTVILHWTGTHWITVPSPNAVDKMGIYGSYQNNLQAVAGAAPNNVWAVGGAVSPDKRDETGQIALIEHWDGHVWRTITLPGVHGAFSDLSLISARDIWAIGNCSICGVAGKDRPILEHWDGHIWRASTLDLPPPRRRASTLLPPYHPKMSGSPAVGFELGVYRCSNIGMADNGNA